MYIYIKILTIRETNEHISTIFGYFKFYNNKSSANQHDFH